MDFPPLQAPGTLANADAVQGIAANDDKRVAIYVENDDELEILRDYLGEWSLRYHQPVVWNGARDFQTYTATTLRFPCVLFINNPKDGHFTYAGPYSRNAEDRLSVDEYCNYLSAADGTPDNTPDLLALL